MTEHYLQVHAVAPYPGKYHTPKLDGDERWYWLIWSMKRGESWLSHSGKHVDPCDYIAEQLAGSWLLDKDALLVPMPRSELFNGGGVWPARNLCGALQTKWKTPRSLPLLSRTATVPKASQASSTGSERPTVAVHMRSMSAAPVPPTVKKVLLVDDTLTRGTQLIAASRALQRAGFTGAISALCGGYTLLSGDSKRDLNQFFALTWRDGDDFAHCEWVPPLPDEAYCDNVLPAPFSTST